MRNDPTAGPRASATAHRARTPRTLAGVACFFAATLLVVTPRPAAGEAPVPTVSTTSGGTWTSAAVAADHALASEAGAAILAAGGSAADAAIATGLVLGVVNPFASGIGGGGFLIYHDAPSGETIALDFRETAPAAATADMFLVDGALSDRSRNGGLAVAIPSEIAGWWALHQRYGRLPWRDVVEPARRLAEEGFLVEPLLATRFDQGGPRLRNAPELFRQFGVEGRWIREGERLRRPELAEALRLVAEQGPDAFYRGPIADDIVDAVARTGGILTHADLADYAVILREPVAIPWRGRTVLTMPFPSAGGVVLGRALRFLDGFHLDRLAHDQPAFAHILLQSMIPGFAVRATLLGDEGRSMTTVAEQLDPATTARDLQTYNPAKSLPPETWAPRARAPDDDGTSHFNVVAPDGSAVACTVTVNTLFGSAVVSPRFGIVLNNEMDDFTSAPGKPNAFGLIAGDANTIVPGARPLSSMAPTLVLRDGRVEGLVGGSGGPRILSGTLQTLVFVGVLGLPAHEALDAPRVHHQWLPDRVALEPGWSSWTTGLPGYGYEIAESPSWAAIQVIWRTPDGWSAASDPRKQGRPAGW